MEATKNTITINKTKFWTNSQDVLICKINSTSSFLTLKAEAIEKYEKAICKLTQGKSVPFLIDFRDNHGNFSAKAAKLLANSTVFKNAKISEAFVINSINSKLLINSYKRIFEPNTPYKIFKDFDEALEYSINNKKIFDASN